MSDVLCEIADVRQQSLSLTILVSERKRYLPMVTRNRTLKLLLLYDELHIKKHQPNAMSRPKIPTQLIDDVNEPAKGQAFAKAD